jgi:pimeloyl-ACP methyl ester carboxylesterase
MAPRPIFIHGAGGGIATWSEQEPRFEGCAVLALPGHPAGTALRSVTAHAEWTARAIGEIPGPRVLVGHSMGGAVAMQVALDHPDLVAGVIVIASGPRLFVPDAALELALSDFAAECERLLRKGWWEPDDATIAAEAALIGEVGPETLIADYTACRGFDIANRLGEVRVPVLVVAGARDGLTPPSLGERLAQGLRQALLVVVPDAGHWVMKDHAAAVDLLIAGFLARLELTDA